MLDKNYFHVLDVLKMQGINGCRSTLIALKSNLEQDDTDFILDTLKSLNYVEQLPNFNWKITYKGKQACFEKRKELFRMYWFPILTAILSYLLGLITDLILLHIQ